MKTLVFGGPCGRKAGHTGDEPQLLLNIHGVVASSAVCSNHEARARLHPVEDIRGEAELSLGVGAEPENVSFWVQALKV